ncbi:MAG: serine hydrolase domain-containing protein [Pseudonocardiaceae bacterium]
MDVSSQDIRPGVCVLVHAPDGQLAQAQVGLANIELAIPLGPNTVFNVGSVAKQITACLAVLTARSASLDLGAPVADFLPRVRVPGITVTDLIRHDSGIRDVESLLSLAGFRELDHYTSDDLLALAYRQVDRAVPSGRFLYSNTNYLMLAKILETIHGISLQQLADQLVFEPLGMRATRFKTDPREVIPQAASSYQQTHDGHWRHQACPVTLPGPGSLWCSAPDLDRWLEHLKQEWTQQGFHAPPFDAEVGYLPSGHPSYRYGAGLYTDTTALEGGAVFHYGHEQGFSAATRLGRNGLRTVCLSNNADIHADHVTAHIVQYLAHGGALNKIHTCLDAFRTEDGTTPRRNVPAAPTDPPVPADQHTWLGTFSCGEVPGVVRLSRHGPTLHLWRRGIADQLDCMCAERQIYGGPGYTLTIPTTNVLGNENINAFTLDLDRAPALHYRIIRNDKP